MTSLSDKHETPADATTRAVHRMMKTDRTPELILQVVTNAAQQVSDLVEQSPERADHACAAGCDFCCHLPVDITVPEALRMVDYLLTVLTPEALASTRSRLMANERRIHGLSYEEHTRARIACALLVDGVCSVYEARPIACRAWNSMDRSCCEIIFHGDPVTMMPPLDMTAYEAVWEVAQGLTEGIRRARLDSHPYELHSLLLRVLDTPNAAQRWLQREDVFAGCTVGAFSKLGPHG